MEVPSGIATDLTPEGGSSSLSVLSDWWSITVREQR